MTSRLRALWRNLRHRDRVERELDDEMRAMLDLLILKALALGELHGLGVSQRIEQITRRTFSVGPGSLFPALHRLEAT